MKPPDHPFRAFVRRRLSREEAIGLSFTVSFLVAGCLAVAIFASLYADRRDERMGSASNGH